jgi:hypothetical protein
LDRFDLPFSLHIYVLRFFQNTFLFKENSAALKILYEFCNDSWLESKDFYGMTPLAASINCGNRNAVAFLLDINASINCDEANGYFLLRTAVSNNDTG